MVNAMKLSSTLRFALLGILLTPLVAQTPAARRGPRTPDGKPDLNGIWQALNTANWDILTHGAQAGNIPSLGAVGAVPPGVGVVEGNVIPYLAAAEAQKKANYAKRWTDDPELKCYMPGVPRANYMPYPFQILQGGNTLMIAYEYAGAVRNVNMGKPTEAAVDSWMGWSNGPWEGETLVIDVTGFHDQTWFYRAGDFHRRSLQYGER